MTDPTPDASPRAADFRRASALMLHHARRDEDGVLAVLNETADEHRQLQLVLAAVRIFESLVTELRTELGQQLIGQQLLELAATEDEQ